MEITIKQIKDLRDQTWVWMSDCKNALEESNWDLDLALEILRKKWIAKAAKRADNVTKEWKIKIEVNWNTAYIVAISCETDFVSKNDTFWEMVSKIMEILKSNPDETEAMKQAEDLKSSEYQLKIGENMKIKTMTKITGEAISYYVHMNNKVASIVIWKIWTDLEKLRQVAMHVAAMNPDVLSPENISEEIITKEKEIQLELMKQDPKNANKPADIMEKIIDGKMSKFREENALLTQQFVINPEVKVKDFIGVDSIISFKRFSI